MEITRFYQQLLELDDPWRVVRVETSPGEGMVNVFLDHRRKAEFGCPECGMPLSVRDHKGPRRWRHVDSCGRMTWLHARVPRVHCLFHRVCQVALPWALPHSHFTTAFEHWAIQVLLETDILGATRLLRLSWDEAWHLMERAVLRGQRRKQPLRSAHLGVDEKAIAKGHQYMTLVCDLDRGTVEHVAMDRKQESLSEFYETLSAAQLAQIEAVAMDMWDPYIAATKAYVPGALEKIVFDRFHVMRHVNDAVNDVRKKEHRALRAAGDETLTGTKYLWLYAEENRPERFAEQWKMLQALHLKTGRAWALKECLRDLWDYRYRAWAERHWKYWYNWATHSQLPPIVKAARTIECHLPNVLTYFVHRITNATCEGMNSKIETIKKTPVAFAIGATFRSPSTSIAVVWISSLGTLTNPFPRRKKIGSNRPRHSRH
jgi:transposase